MMMNGSAGGAAGDDRIAALERKNKEQEALVKGITEELLDMKSIVMKLAKASEERSRQELKAGAAFRAGRPAAGCHGRSSCRREHRCDAAQIRTAGTGSPGGTVDGHDHAD